MAKRSTGKEAKAKTGRPRRFDDPATRQRLIAVLQAGGSRNDAAVAAGVNRTTLTDEVRRNPEFKQAVEEAELAGKVLAMKTVRSAIDSKEPMVAFKAATWFLERKYWREWSRRNPDTIKPDDVINLIGQIMDIVLNIVPPKFHAQIQKGIQETLQAVRKLK